LTDRDGLDVFAVQRGDHLAVVGVTIESVTAFARIESETGPGENINGLGERGVLVGSSAVVISKILLRIISEIA